MIYGRVTNTNSGATANLLDIGTVAAGSLFKIDKTGEVNAKGTVISTNDFKVGAAKHFHHLGRAAIGSPATGIHTLSNAAFDDYNRLQFGGTTSAFPAIKRNGAGLQIKLADDSTFASLGALSISLSGQSLTSAAATNLLDLSATWDTTGNPSLIYARVTNTNSGASSNLIDLGTVANGNLFKVTKAGNISFGAAAAFQQAFEPAGNTAFNIKCYGTTIGGFASTDQPQGLHLNNSSSLMWTNTSGGVNSFANVDLRLSRDGTGILAQRNLGLTQTFRLYNATSATPLVDWDRASFSFTSGNLRIAAENSGTSGYATARGIDFAVSGAVRLKILANGTTNFINEAYFLAPLYGFDGANSYLGLSSSGGINKLFTSSGSTNKNITISPADVAMMTLTQTGVGIGTANPVAELDIAETWNTNISVIGASGNGTTAVITFATQATAIPVGSTVVVTSINPAGYNGTFVVTASSLNSVSYLNATTTTYVTGGNIQQIFTSIKLNVTNTVSNIASKLIDLQVGGSSVFSVRRDGLIQGSSPIYNVNLNGDCYIYNGATARASSLWADECRIVGGPLVLSDSVNVNTSNISAGVALYKEAANILAQRNLGVSQSLRIYNKYTDALTYERGVFDWKTTTDTLRIGTEHLGPGMSARQLDFVTATTIRMSIDTTGRVGIGTTTPTSKLQVTAGDIELETVTNGIIMKAAGTSTRYRITLNAGGTALVFTAI
jgi:hypothetical protein